MNIIKMVLNTNYFMNKIFCLYFHHDIHYEYITIKTSETIKNFGFEKDAKPIDLFKKAYSLFQKIDDERYLKHDK